MNRLLPSRSSQVHNTGVCSPSDGQIETEPDRKHSLQAGLCHLQWTGKPKTKKHGIVVTDTGVTAKYHIMYGKKKLSKQFIESVPLGGRAACKAAGTQHSYNKWLHRSSTQQNLRLNGSLQGVDTKGKEERVTFTPKALSDYMQHQT